MKKANKLFDIIQSVDSFKLLNKLNSTAKNNKNTQEIFLQVNITKDKNQKGFLEKDIFKAARQTTKLTNLKLSGVMAIGPNNKNTKKIQKTFKKSKEIQEKIKKEISPTCVNLSIGMSGDYIIALQEGATHIRIGSKIFS